MAANDQLRAQLKATDAQIEAFVKSLDKFMAQSLRGVLAKLAGGKVAGIEAAGLLGQLRSVLDEAGLNQVLGGLDDIYGEKLRHIQEVFKAVGEKEIFAGTDIKAIDALIQFDTDKVANHIETYLGDAKSQIMRQVITGGTFDPGELTDNLGARLTANVTSELNTLVSGFQRTVTVGAAKESGFELFEYLGPDDGVTREFCQELLDKTPPIYTVEEIEAMDNGQDLDVMTYGGGYNCRHQWRPISEQDAKEEGYDG